jgi:DNA-binding beta-propeller fold protein YncE
MVPVPGMPFGVVSAAAGQWSFVSVDDEVEVMSDRRFAPMRVRFAMLPPITVSAAGEALTHNGRYLLVAGGAGAAVLSVARLERGGRDPVLGLLSTPGPQAVSQLEDGAVEVVTSPDDRYAFVTLENVGQISVFDLRAALADGFRGSGYVGSISLGLGPVGMAISPNRRWLYATSLSASRTGSLPAPGTISVIALRRAETQPSAAVVATAMAGCGPVRVIVSANGRTVWTTAQASDALLGFSAAKLVTDPRHALLADVRVGASPAGMAFTNHGRRIVVADTYRYTTTLHAGALSVVSPSAALARKPALLGHAAAADFPREMSLEPNGRTLLITNYGSDELEAINTLNLP